YIRWCWPSTSGSTDKLHGEWKMKHYGLPAIINQLVLPATSLAHLPKLAVRIPTAAAVPAKGTMLAVAELRPWACQFTRYTSRPTQVFAAGRVMIQVEPDLLFATLVSLSARVKSAVLL